MWFKKLFKKSPNEKTNEQQQIIQQDPEVKQSVICTVSQAQVDMRYANIKIIKTQLLNLPKNQIHFIQSCLFYQKQYFTAKTKYSSQWSKIELIVTDRQILILPNIMGTCTKSISNHNILHINFGKISKIQRIEQKKQPIKLNIYLKDTTIIQIQSIMADRIIQSQKLIRQFGLPNAINKFYAFKYGKVNKNNKWGIYHFQTQMKRIGVLKYIQSNQNCKSFRIFQNINFQYSSTYPLKHIIPLNITDNQLLKCAKFRTKQRFPSLSYLLEYQTGAYSALFRCSQTRGGILGARCPQDQKMIACIAQSTAKISKNRKSKIENNNKINVKIYDARGLSAAWGNKLAGKGFQQTNNYNCDIQFLNIPNIHAVRECYNKIKGQLASQQIFLQILGQSCWIDYLYLILSGAKAMVKSMLNGINVVVHCSDGWDRTTQLSCLTQIVIDPYYRTIQGFAVLIEKDWRHFGHKFRERSGQYNPEMSVKQTSPIFIQFLDCVFQLMNQFPLSFEFNVQFLNFLAEQYQSVTYGTFMANNICEAQRINMQMETISVWSDVYEQLQKYKNKFYIQKGQKILQFSVETRNFVIWKQHFLQQRSIQNQIYNEYYKQYQINRQLKQQLQKQQQQIQQLNSMLK